MARPNPIWHHPHGCHGNLKPGMKVILTCRALCREASGDKWTEENERDHLLVWRITASNHSDYCLERPEEGHSIWADFDHVRVAESADNSFVAEPTPAVQAPMFDVMRQSTEGDTSYRVA